MDTALENDFSRHLAGNRLVSPADLAGAMSLQLEMARAGLQMPVGEILVRQNRLSIEAYRGAWWAAIGSPPPEPPLPLALDPKLDRLSVEKAIGRGMLEPSDLVRFQAFLDWTAGQGIEMGLAEILVRRGFVDPRDLRPERPIPLAPAPAGDDRAPSAESPSRSRTRNRTRRRALASDRDRRRGTRSRAPLSARLVLGIVIGGSIPLLLSGAAIAFLSRGEPAEESGELASSRSTSDPPPLKARSTEAAEKPSASRGQEPGDAVREVQELRERVASLVRERRFDDARREVATVRDALPGDSEVSDATSALAEFIQAAERRHRETAPAARAPADLSREIRDLEAKAKQALEAHRHADAIAIYDRMAEIDPENFSVYLRRADVRVEMRDHAGAHRDFTDALRRAERLTAGTGFLTEILVKRGQVSQLLQDYDSAVADFERSMALDPENGSPAYYRVRALRQLGRTGDALASLPEARSCRFGEGERFLLEAEYGLLLLDRGDRSGALEHLERLETRFPGALESKMNVACQAWAWLQPSLGPADSGRARRLLDRVPLGSGGSYPWYFLVHAAFRQAEGRSAEALEIFERFGHVWSTLPEVGTYYAAAARAMGRSDLSDQVLAIVERLRPDIVEEARRVR